MPRHCMLVEEHTSIVNGSYHDQAKQNKNMHWPTRFKPGNMQRTPPNDHNRTNRCQRRKYSLLSTQQKGTGKLLLMKSHRDYSHSTPPIADSDLFRLLFGISYGVATQEHAERHLKVLQRARAASPCLKKNWNYLSAASIKAHIKG